MKTIRADLLVLVTAALPLVISGCGTPQAAPQRKAPLADAEQRSSPFLNREEYPVRVGRTVGEALRSHRFTIPWIVVRGADGATWFVAERFHAEDRFQRIYVRVAPEEKVTASITAYQNFGDWAALGRKFAPDYRPEAESIASQIGESLRSLSENREGIR
jgi:hypothetical protein